MFFQGPYVFKTKKDTSSSTFHNKISDLVKSMNNILTREVPQLKHPDLVETLANDRASPKISNREKILVAISL